MSVINKFVFFFGLKIKANSKPNFFFFAKLNRDRLCYVRLHLYLPDMSVAELIIFLLWLQFVFWISTF